MPPPGRTKGLASQPGVRHDADKRLIRVGYGMAGNRKPGGGTWQFLAHLPGKEKGAPQEDPCNSGEQQKRPTPCNPPQVVSNRVVISGLTLPGGRFVGIHMASLICPETISRVSSVLNREVKQFGKKYMFDGNEETCWNSDQGTIQWLTLEFPQPVQVSQIQIQFQGGFTSQKCTLQGCRKGEELSPVTSFYPEDTNSLQISFLDPQQQVVMDQLALLKRQASVNSKLASLFSTW